MARDPLAPANVVDEGHNVMRLHADDWLAVVLIDNEATAHLRDSGEISPHAIAAGLRQLADSLDQQVSP